MAISFLTFSSKKTKQTNIKSIDLVFDTKKPKLPQAIRFHQILLQTTTGLRFNI